MENIDIDSIINDIDDIINEVENSFEGDHNTEELQQCVLELIPLPVDQFKVLSVQGVPEKFKTSFSCKIENFDNFVEDYGTKNCETLRILSWNDVNNRKFTTKYYRCQHNTRNDDTKDINDPSKRVKNTNCPYKLTIKKEKHSKVEYDTTIDIEWCHNHPVKSLHALSFRDIADHIKIKVKDLYDRGLLPGAAYKELMKELKSECKDDLDYHLKLADR